MVSATSSAFTLNTESGRDKVTLASYVGPITWTTAPVAGDQIEFPNSVSVSSTGLITGAAGTYTFRHIIAQTGVVQAVSHVISAGNSASVSVTFDASTNDSLSYVTLVSYSGPMTFPTTPVAGDQIAFPSGTDVSNTGAFTGANNIYTVYHIIASTGVIEAISYTHSGTNTAPSLPTLVNKLVNVGDIESFPVTATDPDSGDVLIYAAQPLPTNVELSGSIIRTVGYPAGSGYTTVETVETVVSVVDDSGDTGNDSDSATFVYAVFPANYTGTILTVNEATINPDSPLIDAITSDDISIGDIVDYPTTATDAVGTTRAISFSSDGLMTAVGTRSIKVDNIYYRDKSNSYSRDGPFSVTLQGTGPTLTSPLEVVPNSPTTSGGQMRFTSDESGNYRLIVIASGFGTPTRAQVMAGLGPDGNAPLFDSGLNAQTVAVQETVTVTGLPTQGAGYWVFLALEDQYGGVTLEGPVTLATTTSGNPPIWSAITAQSWTQGAAVSLNLRSFCTDAVTFAIVGLPAGTGLTLNASTGVLSGTPNTFDASGAPGSTTNYTFTVSATNATGTTQTTFDAGVYRLNPPTTISQIVSQSWKQSTSFSLVLSAYISGATSYQIEYDNNGTFQDASSTFAGYGLAFNSSNGVLNGTPNSTMPPDSPITYRARGINADGNGPWLQFVATIDALAAPAFNGPIPAQSFTQGAAVSFNVAPYFSNFTTLAIAGLPVGSGLSFSSAGLLTGSPNSADVSNSPLSLTVTATNADGTAQGTFTATVTAATVPLLIASFPDLSFNIGSSININFLNYIQNATSYQVTGLPQGSGIVQQTNGLGGTWNQTDSDAAPFVVVVTGINANGQVQDAFQINTLAAPSPIIKVTDPAAQVVKFYGDPYRINVQNGGDNWAQFQLYNAGVAYLLNNVTLLKVKLTQGGTTVIYDSVTSPNLFDTSPGSGKFNVKLGQMGLSAGYYNLDIYYRDLQSTNDTEFTLARKILAEVE